jgi:Response regulator containing CheY-like receiver domain and AraC-type DNA-binding domain
MLRKVLVIDDEPYMLEGWKTMIDWNAYGYELCAAASNGEEALKIAAATRPDLVFTDIRMPGIDGIDLIRKLREEQPAGSGYRPKIVIMSGYPEFDYVKRAMPYKIERYMLKPLIPDEIHGLLSELAAGMAAPVTDGAADDGGTADEHGGAVGRVIEYVKGHYRETIRISRLARLVGHHPAYLGYLFKQKTGYSIQEYVHRLRIAEARKLLRRTDHKIAFIAKQLGYRDPDVFTEKFKAMVGMTPSDYRSGVRQG